MPTPKLGDPTFSGGKSEEFSKLITSKFLESLSKRVKEVVKQRKWVKDWASGGCYIHLEVSEFIEALRGKGGDPVSEAADVMIALFAVLGEYNIDAKDVLSELSKTLKALEDGTKGEFGHK